MEAFLKRLKPGDDVIVYYGGGVGGDRREVAKVQRLTKTLIVLDNGLKFLKSSGRKYGGGSGRTWTCLEEATPDKVAQVMAEQRKLCMVRFLSGVNWASLPVDVLEKVGAIVKQTKGEM